MGKHVAVLGVAFLGLAAFAVAAGWLFFSASEPTAGGWSLGPIWPYVVGGLLVVGHSESFPAAHPGFRSCGRTAYERLAG